MHLISPLLAVMTLALSNVASAGCSSGFGSGCGIRSQTFGRGGHGFGGQGFGGCGQGGCGQGYGVDYSYEYMEDTVTWPVNPCEGGCGQRNNGRYMYQYMEDGVTWPSNCCGGRFTQRRGMGMEMM